MGTPLVKRAFFVEEKGVNCEPWGYGVPPKKMGTAPESEQSCGVSK